jgi:hypothetical protein
MSHVRATCPAHLNSFEFITLIILGEYYTNYEVLLCEVFSVLLGALTTFKPAVYSRL